MHGYTATRSLIPSFGAWTKSCFVPRYRSVVCTEACPSRSWICSNSPPDALHNFAQVQRLCRMRHNRSYAESRIMPNQRHCGHARMGLDTAGCGIVLAIACPRMEGVGRSDWTAPFQGGLNTYRAKARQAGPLIRAGQNGVNGVRHREGVLQL